MKKEFATKKYVDGQLPIDPEEVQGWNGRSSTEIWALTIFLGLLLGLTVYLAFII